MTIQGIFWNKFQHFCLENPKIINGGGVIINGTAIINFQKTEMETPLLFFFRGEEIKQLEVIMA